MKKPNLYDLVVSGLSGGDKFQEYIDSLDLEDPETLEYLRGKARSVMSDTQSALWQRPVPLTLIDNVFFDDVENYYGQPIQFLNRSPLELEQYSERYGINMPVNLRDIFLDYSQPEKEGLYETELRPKDYPFVDGGNTVYDIAPFIAIKSIVKKDDNSSYDSLYRKGQKIFNKAIQLEEGEGFRIDAPDFAGTLDLGQSNWSIGRDKKGIYAAITDVWDFEGGGGAYGEVLDKVGNPINMYGRIYLDNYDFFPYDEEVYR